MKQEERDLLGCIVEIFLSYKSLPFKMKKNLFDLAVNANFSYIKDNYEEDFK
jgi:hypothetical protein